MDSFQLLSDYEDAVSDFATHIASQTATSENDHHREAMRLHRRVRTLRVLVQERLRDEP